MRVTGTSPPLAGRRALVTGSAHRTGRRIALALAEAGADVVVHHRSRPDDARETAAGIEARGRRALVAKADLRREDEASAMIDAIVEAWGGLDLLVNNVGTIVWKGVHELSLQEWRENLEGTLDVTFVSCRAALPTMRRQGFGRIVNILDAGADRAGSVPQATAYRIGKTGAWMLTQTLAETEAPFGITVNAVSPGTLDNSERKPPLGDIPAGRYGSPDDVAAAVVFLCGDTAGYLTGSQLKVSGGHQL